MKRFTLFASAIIAAWLTVAGTPVVLRSIERRIATGPSLPFLLSTSDRTDVRSSGLHFVVVVAVAAVAVVLAEIAKFMSGFVTSRIMVLLFQFILVLDSVRAYASDWWTYLGGVAGVWELHSLIWMEPTPVSSVRIPWIAAIVGLVAVASSAYEARRKWHAA